MAFGTAPEALVEQLQSGWQASRTGRDDVPDLVRDGNGDPSSDPNDGEGVLVLKNLDEVAVNRQLHDVIHCYPPEADPMTVQDNGYKEQRVVESVQIDIDLADRSEYDPPKRVSAKERMIGTRDSVADLDEPPYPGIFGEVKYVLETIRRGFDEFDIVRHQPLTMSLESSDAFVAIDVECERIAANTVV